MSTLAELAELIGGKVKGDATRTIVGIATLSSASPAELSFLSGAKYRVEALASNAGALLVPEELVLDEKAFGTRDFLATADLPAALARLVRHFHPVARRQPGVHETAVIDPAAEIAESASIGPYSVVGRDSRIGAATVIEAHVTVGEHCKVGERCHLFPQVVLYAGSCLGDRVIVHAGAVIGSDGFGYASSAAGHQKIPQVGHVELGDDVEIGANTTIDRASLDVTRIGDGTKIDNLVQVGHNVRVGEHCLLVSQSGIAGSTTLGRFVVLAGQSGLGGHLELADGVKVAAKSAVFQNVDRAKDLAGIPAVELPSWRRQQALVRRLPELSRGLRHVEGQCRTKDDESDPT